MVQKREILSYRWWWIVCIIFYRTRYLHEHYTWLCTNKSTDASSLPLQTQIFHGSTKPSLATFTLDRANDADVLAICISHKTTEMNFRYQFVSLSEKTEKKWEKANTKSGRLWRSCNKNKGDKMYLCRCEIHRRYYFASDVLAFKRERKKQAPR